MSDGLRLISAAVTVGAGNAIRRVDPDYFLDNEREVFDFVQHHLRQYRVMPQATTVHQELGIRLPVANETVDFYVDKIEQRYQYNLIREHYGTLREAISDQDIEGALEAAAAMGRARRGNRHGREVMDIREAGDLVMDRLQAARGHAGMSGISSGWLGMDEITGGYQNSDIITYVGRPMLGKTYVLLKQAHASFMADANVLFVTTEMGIEQIARRYASIGMGINPNVLKTGMISTHLARRLRTFYTDMAGHERFKIFSVGMNAKLSALEAMCHEFNPDIVYLDGAYLMKPTASRAATKTERMGEMMDELKGINQEVEVPFVISSQFNRQAGKGGKEGALETISYSDSFGTHSSLVVAIKHGPTDNPYASREFEFLKGREGETGSIAINFKFAPLDMDEFTPEQREAEGTEAADPTALDWMA